MRIAFSLIGNEKWTGGSHYLVNLLGALHVASSDFLEPVMFTSRSRASEVKPLRPYLSQTVFDESFSSWSPAWFMRQAVRGALDNDLVVDRLFRRHEVEAVFQAGLFGTRFSLPCVNWIADFQHLHMPEMFSSTERKLRNRLYRNLARMCRRIVLSSECAGRDFESVLPGYKDRVDILPFTAQIPENVYACDPLDTLSSYNIPEKFFHLPNQFWKHKNHKIVMGALKILKEKKRNIIVICTGNERDYRNPGYFDSLKDSVVRSELTSHISFLGLVPFDHLYPLMRQSIAIMNPSFFEGWSTTVEEAKSLGKKVLLSDIPVHREQAPPGGVYFNPNDPHDLAGKMLEIWENTTAGPDLSMEEQAQASLQARVHAFADRFVQIMRKAIG